GICHDSTHPRPNQRSEVNRDHVGRPLGRFTSRPPVDRSWLAARLLQRIGLSKTYGTAELDTAVMAGADDLAVHDQRCADGDAALAASRAGFGLGDRHEGAVVRILARGDGSKDDTCEATQEGDSRRIGTPHACHSRWAAFTKRRDCGGWWDYTMA